MKILVALVAFFGMAIAQADTAGVWSGEMEYTAEGVVQGKAVGQVTITNDGTVLTIADDLVEENHTFAIQGSDLILGGAVVGHFSDTELSVSFEYPLEATCTQSISLTLSTDTEAVYSNGVSCTGGYADELKGTVTKP